MSQAFQDSFPASIFLAKDYSCKITPWLVSLEQAQLERRDSENLYSSLKDSSVSSVHCVLLVSVFPIHRYTLKFSVMSHKYQDS